MARISVVINTLNEEKNLPRAIASIKGLADEIIVVDMQSDDRTKEVAEEHMTTNEQAMSSQHETLR